jgi:hypothetical protein
VTKFVSLCPDCGVNFPCFNDANHCPGITVPNPLYYTITDPSGSCLNGFSDTMAYGNEEWGAPNPSDFGTMTACACNSPGPGCCSNLGLVGFLGCESSPGPFFWRFGFSAGGCNFASINCQDCFSVQGITQVSCTPFHLQVTMQYSNTFFVCMSTPQNTFTFTVDITE